VKKLERIQVEQSSALAPEMGKTIAEQITQFRSYLQSLGYQPPDTEFTVLVDPDSEMNAYYVTNKMVLGPKLVAMTDVIYAEYAHHMLKQINPKIFDESNWKAQAIFYGLSDYFSCSYEGRPKLGTKFVEVFADKLPDDMRKKGLLRDLLNKRPFVKDSASAPEPHDAGEVWGGVFWDIRSIFGCKSDAAKCSDADKIILAAWKTTEIDPPATMDVRLARSIVENVRQSSGNDQADKVRAAFTRRGLRP
jgi:hypothetical protein